MNARFGLVLAALLLAVSPALAARDAAFMAPNASSSSTGAGDGGAISVEPKADIDTGETVLNIAKRVTLFFVNRTALPVDVVNVAVTSDGNVKAELVGDDCSKGGKIEASSRCSVVVEVTASTPGPWTAEVLLTHKGAGRIVRAKLSGKTSGQVTTEKRESGLAPSTKEIKPIDFGEVEIGSGQVARSSLMVNDSPEPITLYSIDVIAADNGLERLEQGCALDMELKAGESCPVTLTWRPKNKGLVSTDLIIRHSGKLGFVVIPVRGTAKESPEQIKNKEKESKAAQDESKLASKIPPLSADELSKVAGSLPPLDASALPAKATAKASESSGSFRLIGTVGNRAVLLKPDGTTAIVGIGEDISYGEGKEAKLINVAPKEALIFVGGKKKTLPLEAASELTTKPASAPVESAPSAPQPPLKGGR